MFRRERRHSLDERESLPVYYRFRFFHGRPLNDFKRTEERTAFLPLPIVLHFTYYLLTRRVNETLQSLVEMNLIFILRGVVLE